MVDGFGAITWWGFSPALDLQEKYLSLISKLENLDISEDGARKQGKRAIMIIGAGDCRHIFRTIAHAYRHTKRDLSIDVVENNLEIYARHLLLLSIALEPRERLGLQEKTELFLELFGNSLVRPQASEYLQQKSTDFIRMVTDSDYLQACLPVFNFSLLKFKERDQLESIFKFWRNTDPKLFDICKHWEERLRQYFAVRYDSRQNIFDWDYNMKLSKKVNCYYRHYTFFQSLVLEDNSGLMINALDLALDIVVCFETGPLTLTVPISTKVYECVLANLMLVGNGYPVMDWHPIQGGEEIPLMLCAMENGE